jgi:flagellin-like hook-associated protein FlgL
MRLNELAEQSQKGTYREGINRAGLQQEADSILAEIDRIAQPSSSVSIKK